MHRLVEVISGAAVAAISVAIAGTALAADLPRKAPAYAPPVVAPYNWNGFYFGGHVGGAWEHTDTTNVGLINSANFPEGSSRSHTTSGVIGGVQGGYNWQFAPTWLLGVEADYSWADIKNHSNIAGAVNPLIISHLSSSHTAFSTVTGRLGYVANDLLFYVKGGWGWTRFDNSSFTTNAAGAIITTTVGNDNTLSGFVVGAGAEYGFWQNWSAKLEYNFMDLGKGTHSNTVTLGTTAPVLTGASLLRDRDTQIHMVKFGINYHFNFGRLGASYY